MTTAHNTTASEIQTAVSYRGKPFPQTHPDRLATVARLHGLAAPAPDRCRLLELGCGDGGNLIPMAFELPHAELVGIDLDPARIASGVRECEELGLGNIKLEARDIAEVGAEYGKFDYIVAHGVYCWVPSPVRDRLLALCRRLLNEHGVAFISFNTLPGWRSLEYLRDFARLAAETFAELGPEQRLKRIRGLSQLFSEELASDGGRAQHLKELFARLTNTPDYLLAFDYLGEISEPISLGDFVAHAQKHELSYLSDANYFETEWRNLTPRLRGVVAKLSGDTAVREGFADHFTGRLFRRALLCHREAPRTPPRAAGVRQFQVLADAQPLGHGSADRADAPTSFAMLHGARLSVTSPVVKRALSLLRSRWPQAVGFDALLAHATQGLAATTLNEAEGVVINAIWDMYGAGALDLRCRPPSCRGGPAELPCTSRLARHQIARGAVVVATQHHDAAGVPDALSRELFVRLDGTRDREALLTELLALAHAGGLGAASRATTRATLAVEVEQRLASWVKHALLVDPSG